LTRQTGLLALLLVALVPSLAPAQTAAPPDLPTVLVSRQAAAALDLAVGSIVQVAPPDGSRARDFRVAAIYEPTPDPSRLGNAIYAVRLHLPDLLALASTTDVPRGAESVDAINIRLTPGSDAAAFARDVNARLPGISARPAADAGAAAGPFRVLQRFHLAIAIVTIIASTVFLVALTVMLVDERRETVGVLRLIGLPASRVLVQVLLEGMLVAGAGSAFGLVLAIASERAINHFFQWRYDTALLFVQVTPSVALTCVLIAIPLGVSATVVASWLLLRRNALRLARR
jgi:predicted lysophospholipase L1 biosynthesis ABC-type transport system permease subunit